MAFFSIEVIAKIFAYGFFMNGEKSYMRELWNILDFIILTFSYICLWP
jgi:Ion transport protein